MSLMYAAVGFAIASFVFSAINKLAKRKLRQPLFYYNKAGVKQAICAIIDFAKAISGVNSVVGGKVMIPETLVVPLEDAWEFADFPQVFNESLFVPFVSNGLVPIESQKKFFMAQPEDDAREFMRRKTREAFAADWMLRLARYWNKWMVNANEICFVFAIVASVLGWFVMVEVDSRPTTFNAVDGTEVREYSTNGSVTVVNIGRALYRGKVVGVQPVAHDASIVCIKSTRSAVWCASSSLPHREGEDVYFRLIGVVMNETGAEGRREVRDLAIILSKPEVDTLMATGKFSILE
ncbi:MAG: hypothetical protein PHV99_02575 [Candidatus Pacebacteria bacterium]|nr:hypothetical protein [Candidatus Paceibacterota bacterium]